MSSAKFSHLKMVAFLSLVIELSFGEVCSAQDIDFVEVRDEPQHRHRFENEYVRVYDVLLPLGYVTLYHRHSENTIYTVVHPSTLNSLTTEGVKGANTLRRGSVSFSPQRDHPIIHQVRNVGDTVARLIGVELRGIGRVTDEPPITAHGYTKEFDNNFVRVSRLTLDPDESTGEHTIEFPTVAIAVRDAILTRDSTDGSSLTQTIEAAHVLFRDKGVTQRIRNTGDTPLEFVIYELLSTHENP